MVRACDERASERCDASDAKARNAMESVDAVVVWKRRTDGRMETRLSGRARDSDDDLGLVSKRDRVDGGVDDWATMDQRRGMVKTLKRKV
jgi:hypothetical protein